MSRSAMLLFCAVAWAMACRHAQEVGDETQKSAEQEKKDEAPAAPKRAKARRESEVKRPAYPGRPELSTTATGLMKPEGPMRIQKKLADLGYYKGEVTGELDEETAAALRKFQGDHDLARTGAPDRETVKQLGLSEADVWRDQQKREKQERKEREQKHEERENEPRS